VGLSGNNINQNSFLIPCPYQITVYQSSRLILETTSKKLVAKTWPKAVFGAPKGTKQPVGSRGENLFRPPGP
jgi:hypothetical protein